MVETSVESQKTCIQPRFTKTPFLAFNSSGIILNKSRILNNNIPKSIFQYTLSIINYILDEKYSISKKFNINCILTICYVVHDEISCIML